MRWVERITNLLEHHIDLFELEWSYERDLARRKFWGLVAACGFVFSAAVLLQGAALVGLQKFVLSWPLSFLILAIIDLLLAWLVVSATSRRNPAAGAPFEGTRAEMRKSLSWVRNLFS